MRTIDLPKLSLTATILAGTLFTATALGQIAVENGPDASNPVATARAEFLAANPGAGIYDDEPVRGGRISRVYGAAFSHGANPVDSAERFLAEHADLFASDLAQLMPVGPNGDGAHVIALGYDPADESHRFSLVGYTQHVNGIPVFRGDIRLLVRNEPGYPLVLVSNGLRDVSAFAAGFAGKAVPPSKIDTKRISRRALNQFGPGATVGEQEQVVWAGYDGAPADEPRLAYKFVVTGTAVFDRTAKQRMLYVVDAETNRILFQEDQILHNDITATVRGNATQGNAADACGPEALTPLPYARVTVGADIFFTNAQGVVTIPNPAGATLTLTSSLTLAGQYFFVNDAAGGESAVATSSSGGPAELVHNAANTLQDERAEVNAYLHANIARDYLLSFIPTYPTIAGQTGFPINVMVSGTCNAFYDGSSINFYPAGGGCNNTAFSVVVHHEYGHHIVNRAGSGQGAYGEGFSDVVGVLITDTSQLALGFNASTCSSGIRNADNTNQYSATNCSSAGSAIHTCGTLLSGCVWSTRTYLAASNPTTYRSIISDLALNSVLLHTGTAITPAITIDFLTLDDTDANINNGTPHYAEINAGFSDHSMPAPPLELLDIDFPNGQPTSSNPSTGVAFPVTVTGLGGTPVAGSGRIYFRVGTSGSFTNAAMAQSAPNQYVATLPAAPCGSTIQYYFSAQATSGATVFSPSNAPSSLYSVVASTGSGAPFTDTVETNLGWTLTSAGDTATNGLWTRADPIGTTNGGVQVQPENDVTAAPGVNCFFTGQGTSGGSLGQADVDGGLTTLTSPTMNALGGTAFVNYHRWYSNSQGGSPNADTFRVQISNNNGSTWVPLETVGPTGSEVNGGWIFKEFRISDFVTPTAQMKIRFIAEDAGTGSLIEAAIDEVRIRTLLCAVPGDIDGNGSVDGADLASLLGGWGGSGAGDLDGSGTIDGADLALLLSNWG